MDLGSEGDTGGHVRGTTVVLPSAQEQQEISRKRAHVPDCPRKSERTLSRERLAWTKLAAQGFTTLADFFRQKAEKLAEKEKRDTRLGVWLLLLLPNPVPDKK